MIFIDNGNVKVITIPFNTCQIKCSYFGLD
jgi:hypothetical protein